MLIEVRTTPGKDCCTAMHVALAQELDQDPCHHQHRAAEGSSRDEQWAQALQARPDCKPWGHIRAQLEGSKREQGLLVVLGTAVCH